MQMQQDNNNKVYTTILYYNYSSCVYSSVCVITIMILYYCMAKPKANATTIICDSDIQRPKEKSYSRNNTTTTTSRSPLSQSLEYLTFHTLEGYVLPLLPKAPLFIHNMHGCKQRS
jgi:hypothetical protein